MNKMFIFVVVSLVHSSVIQALQCYTGSEMIGVWFDQGGEAIERAYIEEKFPLIECDSQFSQCFKHTCVIYDAYILTKGCALPEGNHSCVSVSTEMCPEPKLNMKRIECVMCDNKNGCNKEDWQNDPLPTTTVELPDYANANIRAVMSNKFVCTAALFIILFDGILWTRYFC